MDLYNNALTENGFKHMITFLKQQNKSVTNNTKNRKKKDYMV